MIEVSIGDGSGPPVKIEPTGVIGAFAVHQRLVGGLPTGATWTVTHVESGLAVWHVKTIAEAIKVAQWLDTAGPIPRTGGVAEMREWKRTLKPEQYTALAAHLQGIAPRVPALQPTAVGAW